MRLSALPFSSNFHAEKKILEITQHVPRPIIQFVGIRKLRASLRFFFLFFSVRGCRNGGEGRRKERKEVNRWRKKREEVQRWEELKVESDTLVGSYDWKSFPFLLSFELVLITHSNDPSKESTYVQRSISKRRIPISIFKRRTFSLFFFTAGRII